MCGGWACAPAAKQVEDAVNRSASWAATIKVVTEQWAQAHVSLRFVRTTIATATTALEKDATKIRALDPAAAARLDRLKTAIEPVMQAVAQNQPDQARDAAAVLTAIIPPDPRPPVGRPE